MFQFRLRKIMLFISALTVLFIVYQLSYSDTKIINPSENHGVLLKEFHKSPLVRTESAPSNDIFVQIGKTSYPQKNTESYVKNGKISNPSNYKQSLFDGEKIVHLDLKGAPPKVSYYREFFPLIKSLGATGLLIEYEDMFPYKSVDIAALNSYTEEDIKTILNLAKENSLDVIPLIQTFGHLEYVLKLEQYKDLREVQHYPQVICPSRNNTFVVLKTMIDEIISLHPGIKYLHIGCDEVYNLGECHFCQDTLVRNSWTKQQLFLSHVTKVAEYIKEKYPGVKTLVWDDEFRKMTTQDLMDFNPGSLIEPVVWKYTPSVETFIPEEIWDKYATVFGSVWIASAFKGATGPDMYITDIEYHLKNHRSWMTLVATYKHELTFKGIMITGWQRYDHFAILCELLPVGLPSLAVSLAYLSQNNLGMRSPPKSVVNILKCDPGLVRCSFPGSAVYEKVHQLDSLMTQISQMEAASETKGWLTQYNIDTGFSSPAHVEGATSDLDRFKMELIYLEQDIRRGMSELYNPDTIEEWIYTFLNPVNKKLQALWDAREKLLAKRVWPKRPLKLHDHEL